MFLVVLALVLAAPAPAATVATDGDCSFRYYCTLSITYTAAPGERNDVTVERDASGSLVIHDAGAIVTGCAAQDPHTVRCAGALGNDTQSVEVNLGDDIANSRAAHVDGGPGNDVLTGEHVLLTGGPGSDRLTAGPGGAAFADGDGARPAPDRYEGSPTAPDSIGYGGRRDDLRIDLRRPGMNNEDYMANVDSATGGAGDDVLIGNDSPNVLMGGAGADRVVGLGGNDDLFTETDRGGEVVREPAARDLLDGGAGNDDLHVQSRSARGNEFRCGPGYDEIDQVQRRDFVRPDCENLALNDTLHIDVRLRARGRVFLTDRDEPGLYTVRAVSGEVVARGRHTLRLNALGRRLLAARGRLPVTVEVRDRDGVNGFRTDLQRR